MTNELKHGSVGTELTQAEWEAITAHVLDAQATGDIIYASSATQLTRLAVGAANTVLRVSGGIPGWSATLAGLTLTDPALGTPASGTLTNCTGLPVAGIAASTSTALGVGSIELGHATDTSLTRSAAGKLAVEGIDVVLLSGAQTLTDKTLSAPTINGTVATTGLTLPAHTTSRITLNDTGIHRNINTSVLQLRGGLWAGGSGGTIVIYGHSEATQPGDIEIWTSNVAGSNDVLRLRIGGAVASATATWSSIQHSGFVLGGQMQTGAYEVEFTEMTAPAAPAANKARLYSEDNGAGKTRLVVRFPTGAAQVIATEP